MELFSLICNIFLYSLAFVLYEGCERHPEGKNTASPCRNIFHAMRLLGCKEILCWRFFSVQESFRKFALINNRTTINE